MHTAEEALVLAHKQQNSTLAFFTPLKFGPKSETEMHRQGAPEYLVVVLMSKT